MLFIIIVGFGFSKYFQQPGIIAVISFFVYVMHAIYFPIFLLSSLRTEGKTQLWLHNPNSGSKLFLAKLAACLSYYMISIFIALVVSYWTINWTEIFHDFQDQVLRSLLLVGVSTSFTSIYLGIWVLFYWTFYHSMRSIPYVKNIRWLIIIALWILLNTIDNTIKNLSIYKSINQIGTIQIHVLQELQFEVSQISANMTSDFGTIHFSVVTGFLYVILTVIVFFTSVWLLERKVEV